MKTLTLSIKQQYFDEIKAGTKTFEEREIRPNNISKYCLMKDGDVVIEDGIVKTVPYDTITLLTGAYKGTRPKMVVKVKSSEVIVLTDEDDNEIVYELDGQEYVACIIRYELGEILS